MFFERSHSSESTLYADLFFKFKIRRSLSGSVSVIVRNVVTGRDIAYILSINHVCIVLVAYIHVHVWER